MLYLKLYASLKPSYGHMSQPKSFQTLINDVGQIIQI